MAADEIDITALTVLIEGLPHPNWHLLTAAVDAKVDDDTEFAHALWTDILRQWLAMMVERLPGSYGVDESDHFLLLAPRPRPNPRLLLNLAERARRTLTERTRGVARLIAPGKHPILIFGEPGRYYDYLAAFFPEGNFGGSSGLFVRDGYPRIAEVGVDQGQLEVTLAHELTHASLAHLSLPMWVEEGLAQMFEHDMTGRGGLVLDSEAAHKHKQFWHSHGLGLLWSGEGFFRADEGQKLTYQLAEILIRLMCEECRARWFGFDRSGPERFREFLRRAHRDDAGQLAAFNYLGFGLEYLAARFLGPGDWTPAFL